MKKREKRETRGEKGMPYLFSTILNSRAPAREEKNTPSGGGRGGGGGSFSARFFFPFILILNAGADREKGGRGVRGKREKGGRRPMCSLASF